MFLLINQFNISKISYDHLNTVASTELIKLSDNFVEDEGQRFFEQPNNVSILKELYNWQVEQQSFDYLIASKQGILIFDHLPKMLSEPFSIQVNQRFFDYFNIRVNSGHLFEKSDYISQNNQISILLGFSYTEYYKINDKIKVAYLGEYFDGTIIGFLEKGSIYNDGMSLRMLNESVVLPSLEAFHSNIPAAAWERPFEFKLYLDKCNGYIILKAEINDIHTQIDKKCLELDIPSFAFLGYPNFSIKLWGLAGEQLLHFQFAFSTLISVFTIFSTSLCLATKLIKMQSIYANLIVNGFRRNFIYLSLLLEVILIYSVAFVLAAILKMMLMHSFIELYSLLLIPIFSILSYIYPLFKIKSMNLFHTLKKE